jgi:transposase
VPRTVPYTLAQFAAEYPNDDACLDALFKKRYGNITCCPNCGVVGAEFYRVKNRKCYACVHCRYQLYPAAGTIFHKSSTPLTVWFSAMYLFSLSKNGVSAAEIQRFTGTTYKTAWRMARQIRIAMKQDTALLAGVCEADEAYVGGRRRSSNRFSNKTPLLGVVERSGNVRVMVSDVASARRVTDFLSATVKMGATLNTDESLLYIRASKVYKRVAVKHSRYEFVRGDAYTNTIEGFWGLLKPSLNGTHRWVSKKHLQFYVNEFVWKYNHRKQPQLYPLLVEAAAQPVSIGD